MADVTPLHAYEIELSEPKVVKCECCGGLSVRLTRFVYRAGDAYAIYYAAYSNNHWNDELAMLVSIGGWSEEGVPPERVAFYCRVWPTEDSYRVSLGDVSDSAWSDVALIGRPLSRAQALEHPWKAAAFEVLDEGFLKDRSLRGFIQRVHCGSAAVPLEYSFGSPDEVHALGERRNERAEVNGRFAVLDRTRFFVRCLLPIPVEGYEQWCIGLWGAVTREDFERLRRSWDDPHAYATFQCSAEIANDLTGFLDLPVTCGMRVTVHVPNPAQAPHLAASSGAIADLLAKPRPRAEFEQYAVARGML